MKEYDFIIETIKKAGKSVIQSREKGFDVMIKGGDAQDIVTSADYEINKFIIEEIKKQFPEHGIYSEESDKLNEQTDKLWVIDPIDGSANFSQNIPHFAICIGFLGGGVPVAGAVYNPITNELFSFEKGKGAFLNGKRIHVSKNDNLSNSMVLFCVGRNKELRNEEINFFDRLIKNVNKTRNFSSSALDTCFVASGRVDANIYGTLSTLDIASAIGILIEAGGVITDDCGNTPDFSFEPKRIFMANNKKMINGLLGLL